jgi:two-component system, OmpR family, alkaline phosphatase synthesis response regulator PhoP
LTRVLVIEDSELGDGLRANLEAEGFDVEVAADGRSGLGRARDFDPDLLILDLMLPDLDGLQILRALRNEGRGLAILVLTARGQESDKVLALKLGADDYLTKPFGVLELLARVEALLRRSGAARGASYRFGDVELREATRTVVRRGRTVEVTPKEFDLLCALLRAGGAVVSRADLLRQVWGYRSAAATRTLDTHVAELRRKLEPEPAEPRHILTVRKIGYRITG